jgi:TPR repeat protein
VAPTVAGTTVSPDDGSVRDGLGCNNLGIQLRAQGNVAANKSRALELFEKSCDLGFAAGCGSLGYALLQSSRETTRVHRGRQG